MGWREKGECRDEEQGRDEGCCWYWGGDGLMGILGGLIFGGCGIKCLMDKMDFDVSALCRMEV